MADEDRELIPIRREHQFAQLALGLAAVALFVIVGAVVIGPLAGHGAVAAGREGWRGLAFTAAFLGFASAVGAARIRWLSQTGSVRIRRPRPFATDVEEIDDATRHVVVDLEQARLVWAGLVSPAELFARITESVERGTRTVRVETHLTVDTSRFPDGAAQAIPVLLARRGELQHGIRVLDGSGARLSTVPYTDAAAILERAVFALLQASGPAALVAYLRGDLRTSLRGRVLGVVSADRDAAAEADSLAADLRAVTGHGAEDVFLEAAATLVEKAGRAYPVFVTVRREESAGRAGWGATVRLTVERTLVPAVRRFQERPRDAWDAATAWFRRFVEAQEHALGIPPQSTDYALSSAHRARSYHLVVRGPQGSYVAAQELRRADRAGTRLTTEDLAKVPYAMNARLGQRTAHLYMRPGRTRALPDLQYSVRFAERMPGSMSTAFVASVTTTLIAAAIAAVSLNTTQDSSGLLQILLAFPLALTATSSFASGTPFWGGDLGARWSTVVTVAVLASTLWLSVLPGTPGVESAGLAVGWGFLLIVAATNTLICLVSWLTRAAVQRHFLNRVIEDEADADE